MLNKIKEKITAFTKEVFSDISKLNVNLLFSNTKFLIILILSIVAILIVFTKLSFGLLIKGILSIAVFYFLFLWKNK